MKFRICAVGKCKDSNMLALMNNYIKRFSKHKFEIYEIKPTSSANESVDLLRASEGTHRILLDEKGKLYTSKDFASHLEKIASSNSSAISFLIGGADGHSAELKSKIKDAFSLSKLTLPHMLARLVLVEQLYRANSILSGHPYHRS